MKFRKIEKWDIYETWKAIDKKTGIISYIRKMPKNYKNNEFFHFQISSAKNPLIYIRYDSIDDLLLFTTFKETEYALKKWLHENLQGLL